MAGLQMAAQRMGDIKPYACAPGAENLTCKFHELDDVKVEMFDQVVLVEQLEYNVKQWPAVRQLIQREYIKRPIRRLLQTTLQNETECKHRSP